MGSTCLPRAHRDGRDARSRRECPAVRNRARRVPVRTLNGGRVDDTVLAPGWTAYEHRLRYHVYDVTALVRAGSQRGRRPPGQRLVSRLRLGWERALYGDRLALLAQLEITTDDGTVHVLATDGSWRARDSEVVDDDLYDGQTHGPAPTRRRVDDRSPRVSDRARDGPERPRRPRRPADPADRPPAGAAGVGSSRPVAPLSTSARTPSGWVRLRIRTLPAGTEVVVRHAEVLEDDELGTRPLRAAKATDTYVVAGGDVVLEPSLTLHGFRYAEVSGVPDLRPDDVELVVIGSDLERTGWFDLLARRLDRLHENVVWSMRGNFVDLPTDCPQRDERLGWTGDIQVFAPTATFLFDTAGMLTSWLADLAAEQFPDGSVPHVVPERRPHQRPPVPAAAAWGDAAVVVPWTLYQRTGDRGLLARQLPSMCGWVDRMAALAGPDRLVGRRLPVRRLARPGRPAGGPGPRQGRPGRAWPPRTWSARPQILADAAAVLGPRRRRRAVRASWPRSPRRVRARPTSPRPAGCSPTRRRSTRWRSSGTCSPTRSSAARGRTSARRPDPPVRLPDRHRLRRHAADLRRTDRRRARRRRLPAAAADRVPVVALPGHHGRDDDLGALGQHAARRQHQPGRDDVVQPLRARCGRRLAAPQRRGPRARGAGLPARLLVDPRPTAKLTTPTRGT